METSVRMLPKKAYSFKETVKYMRLNHSIDISEKDLIEYIQNGDIKVCIFIQGDSRYIGSINRKDLDADSIDVADVVMDIEEKYGFEFSDEDAENIVQIKDLVRVIEERK